MAMIKANAYGHGLLPVAKAVAQQTDAFGVARLQEALILRNNGVICPIMVMLGFFDAEELEQMGRHHLTPIIHTSEQIDLLEAAALPQPIQVWLKVDTGMHRMGFTAEEIPIVYRRLQACKQITPSTVLMTHFARADELTEFTTPSQLEAFARFIADEQAKSSANSAGIMAWPASHHDWVRPGIMLYGVSPFAGRVGKDFDLKPVMTLMARIVAIHDLHAGDAVGYGGAWVCPDERRIAVVAIGYGDGYPRNARNGTPVLVNGVRCSLVGRVSMDLITIDLSCCPEAKLGDPVVLWGEGLPIEEVAACADTIAYELLCQVTPRVALIPC